jgi:uncharacterized glyoxalase superfamily protein PhnB
MKVTRIVPLHVVDRIEPVLPFWCEAMGFTIVVEVPHEGEKGFVLLARDGEEIMLQTAASVRADLGDLSPFPASLLYVNVASLDEVMAHLPAGTKPVVGPRKTFYGADEVFVRDPAGTLVGFAQRPE